MALANREYIHWLADTVRSNCKLSTPLDVDAAINRLSGKITEIFGADYEAKIEKTGEGFLITLCPDKGSTEERRRFTVAHELGHLFLHMGYLVDQSKWSSTGAYTDSVYYRYGFSSEEAEANEFAGCLLMPASEYLAVAKRHLVANAYDVQAIARHFDVSIPAATTRGRFLGVLGWD